MISWPAASLHVREKATIPPPDLRVPGCVGQPFPRALTNTRVVPVLISTIHVQASPSRGFTLATHLLTRSRRNVTLWLAVFSTARARSHFSIQGQRVKWQLSGVIRVAGAGFCESSGKAYRRRKSGDARGRKLFSGKKRKRRKKRRKKETPRCQHEPTLDNVNAKTLHLPAVRNLNQKIPSDLAVN